MSDFPEQFTFTPIGYVECPQKYRYEAPRQGVFADNEGLIRLQPRLNLETAIRDLSGFDRLWIVYCFHLNHGWKPAVRPPVVKDDRKIGVLATRSPHRPNPIGLSCVELERIDGLKLYIRNFDMLDGTPVLDIKPYIPAADAFPESRTGWLPPPPPPGELEILRAVMDKAALIREASGLDLVTFCRTQLQLDPLNSERKRVSAMDDGSWMIGCRTWQIFFRFDATLGKVTVTDILSAYTDEELLPGADDRYGDKDVHRAFLQHFPR